LSPRLTKHQALKMYWRNGGIAPRILRWVLDGGECSASRTGRFIPGEKIHGIHWLGGWVGPRTGLDAVAKKNIPSQYRESNPDCSAQCHID